MFTSKTDLIITREEATLALVTESIVFQIDQSTHSFVDQISQQIKSTIQNLHGWYDHLEFPNIRPEDKRVARPLDIFYASLTNVLRRDLTRILNLYSFANDVESKALSLSSNPEAIFARAKDLIVKILSSTRNASVQDAIITEYDFRSTSDVERGDGFQEQSAGILTTNVTRSDVTTVSTTIEPSRNIYASNPLSGIKGDPQTALGLATLYYDTGPDLLGLTFKAKSANLFNLYSITMNSRFTIVSVEADFVGNGAFTNVTDQIIGRPVNIKGEAFAQPTPASIIQADGTSKYTLWFPEPVYAINVVVSIEDTQLQQTEVVTILDNHGKVMDTFTSDESVIYLRKVPVDGFESKMGELQQRANLGEVKVQPLTSSIRIINVAGVNAQVVSGATSSSSRLRLVVSTKALSSVEIYVDAYDPEGLIKYFVDSTRTERIPIDPVNSNPINPTKVEFQSPYPQQINILVDIPAGGTYNPTLGGIAIRTKEIDV